MRAYVCEHTYIIYACVCARAHAIINVKTNLIMIDLIIILGGVDYSLSLTGLKRRALHYYT